MQLHNYLDTLSRAKLDALIRLAGLPKKNGHTKRDCVERLCMAADQWMPSLVALLP